MTNNPTTGKLSKSDYRYLMSLLSKAQAEAEEVIKSDGDNKREARLTVRRIMRIRLALIDLDKRTKK
jgi:hypothetical protein